MRTLSALSGGPRVGRGGALQRSTGQLPPGPVYGERPPVMTPVNAPNTGLIGSEEALQGGLEGALAALGGGGVNSGTITANRAGIDSNRDLAMSTAMRGVDALDPFVKPGMEAHNTQAALSGAMGSDAQARAFEDFRASPGQEYLVNEAEKALLRRSAALGGLGGGDVRQELQANAIGLAAQDYDRYYDRLGAVGDRGLSASGMANNLYALGGNAAIAAGGHHAGLSGSEVSANLGLRAAGINSRTALARDAGRYAFDTGRLMSEGRTDAGSALANLYNAQGSGMGSIYGTGYGNLANILGAVGENQYDSDVSRAGALSNVNLNGASLVSGLPGLPGLQQNAGLGRNIGESRYAMHRATKEGGDAMQSWQSVIGNFMGGFGG